MGTKQGKVLTYSEKLLFLKLRENLITLPM